MRATHNGYADVFRLGQIWCWSVLTTTSSCEWCKCCVTMATTIQMYVVYPVGGIYCNISFSDSQKVTLTECNTCWFYTTQGVWNLKYDRKKNQNSWLPFGIRLVLQETFFFVCLEMLHVFMIFRSLIETDSRRCYRVVSPPWWQKSIKYKTFFFATSD